MSKLHHIGIRIGGLVMSNNMHSVDYYSTSAELGMTVEEMTPSALSAMDIIVGYDPLFVSFVDESQSRTFPIGSWEIEFGDGCLYGLTSAERKYLKYYVSNGHFEDGGGEYTDFMYRKNTSGQHTHYDITALSSVFRIPGDIELMWNPSMNRENYTRSQSIRQFGATNVMNPADWEKCTSSNRNGISYPTMRMTGNASTSAAGNVHVTTMVLSGDPIKYRSDYYGDVNGISVELDTPAFGQQDWPNTDLQYSEIFKTVASGGHVYYDDLVGDDCSKIGMGLSIDNKTRPVFGHLYKGPGVYTSVYKVKPRSKADYYAQLLEERNFVESGKEFLTYTVVVRPTCPCIKVRVYDNYERVNGTIVTDPRSGHPVFKREMETISDGVTSSRLMHAALSSTAYSADDPANYGGDDFSYVDFNPRIITLYNRNHDKIFEGVSGYAPFVRASCKCMVRPNSFPISAVSIDHGDWFLDRVEGEDTATFGQYETGWPFWKPNTVHGGQWNERKQAVEFTNTHTFVMPGLYKATAHIHYDTERISDFWIGETSSCDMESMGSYYVLVQEIMPKSPRISAVSAGSDTIGNTDITFKFDVSAGSFPIEDVVWKFDDGSEDLVLTRNTSGGYLTSSIVQKYTTAQYIGNGTAYGYSIPGENYGALDASAASADDYNKKYPEYDPRDWYVTHRFRRSSVEDINSQVVSAIGYVSNTGTMTMATSFIGLSAMPSFHDVEGVVRVIDTRLSTDDDNLVITMEGNKNGTTNLYNIEWSGKTNG